MPLLMFPYQPLLTSLPFAVAQIFLCVLEFEPLAAQKQMVLHSFVRKPYCCRRLRFESMGMDMEQLSALGLAS